MTPTQTNLARAFGHNLADHPDEAWEPMLEEAMRFAESIQTAREKERENPPYAFWLGADADGR